jgi:hypothetical protein
LALSVAAERDELAEPDPDGQLPPPARGRVQHNASTAVPSRPARVGTDDARDPAGGDVDDPGRDLSPDVDAEGMAPQSGWFAPG